MKAGQNQVILQKLCELCPKGQAAQKKMFGCPVIFVGGQMFAGIYRKSLFIRVGEAKKEEMISEGKAKPFIPKGREMKQYITLHLSLDVSDSTFTKLVNASLEQPVFRVGARHT